MTTNTNTTEPSVAAPADPLAPYFGKHVAWNMERTRVLASGRDITEVARKLDEQGVSLEHVILSYVFHPDEVLIGGISFQEMLPE